MVVVIRMSIAWNLTADGRSYYGGLCSKVVNAVS